MFHNFCNKKGEKSAADLILIAKDFSEWIILEVELAIKQSSNQINQSISQSFDQALTNVLSINQRKMENTQLASNQSIRPIEHFFNYQIVVQLRRGYYL